MHEVEDAVAERNLPAPRLRGPRVLLIRPRTSFVPELYKSIEHI